MGNEDDGLAFVTQFLSDAVQFFGLTLGQSSGRFVHDDDLCVQRQSLCDLDHLLLSNRKVAHQFTGGEVCIQFLQQLICLFVHFLPLNHAVLLLQVTDKDVFRHAQVGVCSNMLINSSNTCVLGITGGFELHHIAIKTHFAFFGLVNAHDDLNESGLACAVFTHQCMDLTGFQIKLHIVQRLNTGEDLGDAAELQNGFAHYKFSFLRDCPSTESHTDFISLGIYRFSFVHLAQLTMRLFVYSAYFCFFHKKVYHFAPILCIISPIVRKCKSFFSRNSL